ncbi:MAG: flagellar assembly protein FliW [Desulfobacteraceae bacterium]
MKINTRKYGELTIDEDRILHMPKGLPGFPGLDRFALLEDPKTAPFCWFQSVEEPDISLVVMNPFLFKPDYRIEQLDGLMSEMGWNDVKTEQLVIYVVVNISGSGESRKITANLIGPLVINPNTKEAVQVVMSDSDYSHQHNVLAPS